jgi:hypothetical protein
MAGSLGELVQILSAAGTNVERVRFFADNREESELGAEPHDKSNEKVCLSPELAGEAGDGG